MKYLKRFFIGLLILIFLSAGTVFVVITFFKKELTNLLINNLKTNYGLTLKVADIRVSFFDNWPHASVKLKDVFVASDLNTKNEPILKAGSLSLSFNLRKMLDKEFVVKYISIADAEIFLLRNADGTKNFEFKKQQPDTTRVTSAISFEVNKIAIRNVKFLFLNKEKEQRIAFNFADVGINLKQYADGLEATIKGKTVIDGLLFNVKNGEFLKHTRTLLNLQLNYISKDKTLCIYPPSYAEIEGHRYNLTSLINLGEDKELAMQIESTKIKCERVAALLSPKIRKTLSNFEVKRPIDAKVLIVVNLGQKQDPIILAEVIGQHCDLSIGNSKIPYSNLFFRGRIISLDSTKQMGDPEHARIIFDPVKGKIYDFSFTASVSVTNFNKPQIAIEASLLIEAKKIKFDVAKDFQLNGSALATIKYNGPAQHINKEEFLREPMKLTAYLLFNDLSYKEIERPYVYTINGKANLNNKDLKFDNMRVKAGFAEAVVMGKAEGFMQYLFGKSKGFKAIVSARTGILDLNPLFAKGENVSETKTKETKETKEGNKKIDQSHFEFAVKLFADKLIFRKVEATNVDLDLFYKENSFNIKSASLNTCDGKILAKAMVKDFNKLDADVSVQNVDVTRLFEQFENFGQEAISSTNLKGNISLDAKYKTDLDEKMNLKPETMAGEVKLKLKNGHLINFEPVQNLSNFLFRNRDFNDVSFSELNETFKFRGYEMQIQELEIGSNVLNLYVVNGLYNFKGNSNINILIPWSNLKKRGKNYIPKNSGESAENTKGAKLNFSGPSKKMKISMGHKEQEKRFW